MCEDEYFDEKRQSFSMDSFEFSNGEVLKNVNVEYIRIPDEPILPYIKSPSLYLKYTPVGLVKQWLLKFLAAVNKKTLNKAVIINKTIMAFKPFTINLKGTLEILIQIPKNTAAKANDATPLHENREIINSIVANNFTRGSNLCTTDSAG